MTKTLTDVTTQAQDQFFEALEGVHDAVLEGVKLWKGAVSAVIPEDLTKNVALPKADWLPSPVSTLGLGWDFAEKLFAVQRAALEGHVPGEWLAKTF